MDRRGKSYYFSKCVYNVNIASFSFSINFDSFYISLGDAYRDCVDAME